MNGAQALIRTVVDGGVDVCFTNPGTSEMHFVAALDSVPEMRGALGLFEGVVTGAADGYGRMADKPAATLLHLGPGLGNRLANLHNARRARTPLATIVGDHATYHVQHDAPLQSDIESAARNVTGRTRASRRPAGVVDAKAPVSFFAYPEKPSYLVPDGCDVHVLASGADDAVGALEHLADVVGGADPTTQPAQRPDRPTGELTGEAVANAIGALLPEGAIVSDEANTAGLWIAAATAGAPPHDSLTLTGGAIGQ